MTDIKSVKTNPVNIPKIADDKKEKPVNGDLKTAVVNSIKPDAPKAREMHFIPKPV